MSTYICERCGAIENTACCDHYYDVLWRRHEGTLKSDETEYLCSKCTTGQWHGRFPREHWSKIGISEVLRLQKLNQGDFINGRNHLRNIGVIGSKKNTIKEIPWEE